MLTVALGAIASSVIASWRTAENRIEENSQLRGRDIPLGGYDGRKRTVPFLIYIKDVARQVDHMVETGLILDDHETPWIQHSTQFFDVFGRNCGRPFLREVEAWQQQEAAYDARPPIQNTRNFILQLFLWRDAKAQIVNPQVGGNVSSRRAPHVPKVKFEGKLRSVRIIGNAVRSDSGSYPSAIENTLVALLARFDVSLRLHNVGLSKIDEDLSPYKSSGNRGEPTGDQIFKFQIPEEWIIFLQGFGFWLLVTGAAIRCAAVGHTRSSRVAIIVALMLFCVAWIGYLWIIFHEYCSVFSVC